MEARSGHPIARAIVAFAEQQGVRPQPADDFQIIQGKGATGRWNGKQYWLGSHRYLEERGADTPDIHVALDALASSGRTVVVIGEEAHVCGFVALADPVRATARETVAGLRRAGIEHVIILTGDNEPTARAIAVQTGITEFEAELLPGDKLAAIERLVGQYGQVAMIGDGVNDAPAMARATLGVAMGAAGTDTAIETADVALMQDDLRKIPEFIRLSRRASMVLKQNIAFAIGVKAVFFILAFLGVATLWMAVFADMGASLLVVANGLRLLKLPAS